MEWVKLFGVLFGMEEQAEAYFEAQKALVEDATAAQAYGKTVAMGYITSTDKCYARNGGDYMAQLIGMGRAARTSWPIWSRRRAAIPI